MIESVTIKVGALSTETVSEKVHPLASVRSTV